MEEEDRDEGGGSDAYHHVVFKRSASDPEHCLQHDRQHRGLQAEEQTGDIAYVSIGGIDVAQPKDGDEARKHEQSSGDQAANRPVEQPADIDRQLMGLWPGKQHAVVERMQEAMFADPSFFVDDDAVHDGDLSRRSAETERRNSCPHFRRLTQEGLCRGSPRAVPFHIHYFGHITAPASGWANYGSRRWRRGTNGKTRHRASDRRRAAAGHL